MNQNVNERNNHSLF